MLNAILLIITFMIILSFALLFYVILKVTPEEAFASSMMSIMLLIYIAGLVGNTRIAVYIVYAMAAIGVISFIIFPKHNANGLRRQFFSPAIVMLFLVMCVGIVAFKGFIICGWDELYQWGKAANFMVEYDKLPKGVDFSGEAGLLSSTTFFHYFIERIPSWVNGSITESNYYVSNLLLWFAALILPFSGCRWKQWKQVALYGTFHFILTAMIYVQPYYNIYTDQATAYWSGSLIAWFLLKKHNRKNIYIIPLVLINVGFMKSMEGPLFAVIAMASIIILHITWRKESGLKVVPGNWRRRLLSKRGVAVVAAIISPFILVVIWSVISGQHGLLRFHSLQTIPGEENRAILTLKAMIGWIFKPVNLKYDSLYLSYGMFIILTITMVYAIYPLVIGSKYLLRFQKLMKVYILGFLGYFLIMYIAYMSVFGYTDSTRAWSLNRYYSDYMMLGIVPLTIPLFINLEKTPKQWITALKRSMVLISICLIIYGSGDYFLGKLAHVYAVDVTRYARVEELDQYCEKVKKLTGEEGKIYFINQKRSGLYTLTADYNMGNQLSRGGMCFKFREDTGTAILGLTDYPVETLPNVLAEQNYEYLWVYSTNTYFTDSMKELFNVSKVKNGCFYKVLHGENGVVLEYLGRIK